MLNQDPETSTRWRESMWIEDEFIIEISSPLYYKYINKSKILKKKTPVNHELIKLNAR